MITLALDASTYTGDVAVIVDGRVAAECTTAMRGQQEERLMPAVARALADAHVVAPAIDRIVCGSGPGSFTSLRIAGAIAKGLATGLGRPLFGVPSPALVVGGTELAPGRYLVAIDALRGELYAALYEVEQNGEVEELDPARLLRAEDVHRVATELGASVVGPAAIEGGIVATPRARAVVRLERMIARAGAVDVGGWEPAYGRLAEAQVRWESTHGRPLPTA